MMRVIVPQTPELLSTSVEEKDEVEGLTWDHAKTYAQGEKCKYLHVAYESLCDDNLNMNPEATWSGEDAKWKKLGATMPYKMLDEFIETQTVADAGQKLSFCVSYDRCDAFALLNVQGYDLRAHIWDTDYRPEQIVWPSEWEFWNDIPHLSLWEYNFLSVTSAWRLIQDISSLSLYEYNYSPIVCVNTFFRTDTVMPLHGKLCVEIDPGHNDVKCALGSIIVGRSHKLGWTKYDAELGFIDYSRKSTDDYGHTTLVRRTSANSMSLPLYLHPVRFDAVKQTLDATRGIPCLWVGDNIDKGVQSLTVYGWLEDYRMVYSGPNEVQLALEIQGMV